MFYGKEEDDVNDWVRQFEIAFTAIGKAAGNNGVRQAAFAATLKEANIGNLTNWGDADNDNDLKHDKIKRKFTREDIIRRKLQELSIIQQGINEEYIVGKMILSQTSGSNQQGNQGNPVFEKMNELLKENYQDDLVKELEKLKLAKLEQEINSLKGELNGQMGGNQGFKNKKPQKFRNNNGNNQREEDSDDDEQYMYQGFARNLNPVPVRRSERNKNRVANNERDRRRNEQWANQVKRNNKIPNVEEFNPVNAFLNANVPINWTQYINEKQNVKKKLKVLVDIGVEPSAITNELRKDLNVPIVKKSNVILRIANGKSIASLGIAELEVEINQGLKIPLKVEVIESKQMDLILGTDLLKHGVIDMKERLLTIRMNDEENEIPIDCKGQNKEDESSSKNSEDLEGSDESESESNKEYEEGNEEELFIVLEEEQNRKNKKSAK
ncbi:hypothetical protein RhiirC2_787225 [Rhizophagus irregularis]|uniref:Uncharacterized protein n=1 Tax=Rhizophagus irregularis TaxID=588596 RepID=A0A2N1MSP1_9GLOM|nr:hypothetical protein RhiirC2_787225 [Rhizophagus irregularis]